MATIQRDQVTHAQVSNLFWINFTLSIALCIAGVAVAPLVASIYNEPRLAMIMIVMSLSFIIAGISVQHDAILRRQMRFKVISIIDTVSLALGLIAGIAAALAGLSYWALLVSPITTALAATIMRWATTRWIPSMLSRGSGVRPMLSFGANLTGAGFAGYVATNATSFSVGFVGGVQLLGLFNRANVLTSIPSSQILPPVMNVIQPALARVSGDATRFRNVMTSIMGKLVLGTMFVTMVMALLADWIIYILLGDGWGEAVPIFRLLAIFSLVEPIASFLAVSLVAAGKAKALLNWKIITLIIILISLSIGSYWGVYGVIAAYALSGVFIRLPLFLYYSSRFLPVTFIELIKTLLIPLVCALATAVTVYSLRLFLSIQQPMLGLILFTIIALCIYIFLLLIFKSTRSELKEISKLTKILSRPKTV